MERAKRFELSTTCLGSRSSTTELRPRILRTGDLATINACGQVAADTSASSG